jgi:hypothetical protein
MQANHAQSNTQSHHRLVSRLASLTCGLAACVLSAPAQAFYTPGQFGVSPTGAANYTIPIAIPPGTAGMVPSLSINYSSQGGNGLLGVGWSLSGLSAITRCPKTQVQDGVREPVKYNTSDKYCLDGQRLVLFAGTYGANGAEYRTERDSFSRIVSYGTSGSPVTGVGYFKVWTKAGLIMEYGNTADSLIEQQGKSSVQVWALNRVTDTKGNYYKITYQDNGNAIGEFYPTRIDYTGNANAGLQPYNSIRFVYQTRTDSPVMYDNTGSRIQITQRLTNIQTYAKVNNADTLVKDYKLTYAISPATNRSRITKITEYDGANTPLPATTIAWDATGDATGNAAPTTVSTALWRSGPNGWDHRYLGDFNGDGKTDLLAQWTDIATSGMLCTGLDTSMSCPAIALPNGAVGKGVVADFNSDGYDDYLGGNQLCHGPALTTCVATGVSSPTRSYVGNVNGDQYPDIIFYKAVWVRYVSGDEGSVYTFSRGYCLGPDLNTCAGASIGNATVKGPPGLPPGVNDIISGDFNADGKTDLIYTTDNGGTYLCSGVAVAQGAAACTLMNSGYWGSYYQLHSSDFNGDGISDLYLIGDGGSYFCPGPGIATANNCQLVANTAGAWKTAYRVLPGDYNGDGISDLYLVGTANSYFCAGPGISAANNCVTKVTGDWKSLYDIRPGDYDGDGTSDLFLITDTSRQFVEAGAGHADRVAGITNGLGAVTSITYKPLTDATVYTKGTGVNVMGSAYLELQAPMYVVSSVSSSNGVGSGTVGSSYFYWRARAHMAGGGFMGFEIVRSCDTNTTPNICTQTTYTQDYPHQGLATKVLKFVKNGTTTPYLNLVTNIWGYRNWTYSNNSLLGTIYHVPTLDTTQEVSYELASGGTAQGAVITNVTTTNTYDGYGNPMVITVSSTDAAGQVYRKVTTNTYDNITAGVNWLLGRLKTATVSSTTP